MNQIKKKKRYDRTIISHKLEKHEQINMVEIDILNKGDVKGKNHIPSLIPVDVVNSFRRKKLTYTVSNHLEAVDYLQSNISFGEFCDFVIQSLDIIQNCKSFGLRIGNLEMNLDLVFYYYQRHQVKMIYWPIISLDEYANEKNFLQTMGTCYACSRNDVEYRKAYLDLFQKRRKFDLDRFRQEVEELSKKWLQNRLSGKEPIRSKGSASIGELDEGVTVDLRQPTLVRLSTQEKIPICKWPFLIGRSMDVCSYVIEDNPNISRKHAELVRRNRKTYIVDKNSSNGTRVRGETVQPDKETLIRSGDQIELGGEKFIYYAQGE